MPVSVNHPSPSIWRDEHINLRITTLREYDAEFMMDRVVVQVFTGHRTGYSRVGGIDPDTSPEEIADLVAELRPQMRRSAIDHALQLGFNAKIDRIRNDLDRVHKSNRDLRDEIAWLRRPRWWHRITKPAASAYLWLAGVK